MATCPAGLRKMSKIAVGDAGMGRVTSIRSDVTMESGMVNSFRT